MRVGVIRNDLSGPILLADLEPVSQQNASVDPPGQVRYLSYPTVASIEALLSDPTTGVGAAITGGTITFPVEIQAPNNVLRLRTSSSGTYVNYTIAPGEYSLSTLVAAINAALVGSGIQAVAGGSDNVILESKAYGVGSYIQNETSANGSTANTVLVLANGSTRTMVSAATILTGVGLPGSLNVATTTLAGLGATTAANALAPTFNAGLARGVEALRDLLAPEFAETDVALESFLTGGLYGYRNAGFNPDPRSPSSTAGAAIAVLENDGVTAFSTGNTLPVIDAAKFNEPGAGDLTIEGSGLGGESGGSTNLLRTTKVMVGSVVLTQAQIEGASGSVSDSEIIIPASLLPAAAIMPVRVQYRQKVSAAFNSTVS